MICPMDFFEIPQFVEIMWLLKQLWENIKLENLRNVSDLPCVRKKQHLDLDLI